MRIYIPWPIHQIKGFRVDQKSKFVDFHSGETRLLLQYLLEYFLVGPIVTHTAIVLSLTPKYCVRYYMVYIACGFILQYSLLSSNTFFWQILAQKQIFTVS